MELELRNKSVIVTGGGSNIGRAITLGFAVEGANITVAEIDEKQGERVAAEARASGAAGVNVVRTDVTDFEQVKNMVRSANEVFGTVDVLVNNVGWDNMAFFSQTTPDFWEKVVRLNYFGVLNCTNAVLPTMIKNKRGAIVSISSDASRQGELREAVYGGCKAAVNSFMKTIAKENGRFGIRCNSVCPGITLPKPGDSVGDLSMWKDADAMFSPEQFERAAMALPLKRLGEPSDIVGPVLFMASDAVAGFVTGQVLSASGGYSMIG